MEDLLKNLFKDVYPYSVNVQNIYTERNEPLSFRRSNENLFNGERRRSMSGEGISTDINMIHSYTTSNHSDVSAKPRQGLNSDYFVPRTRNDEFKSNQIREPGWERAPTSASKPSTDDVHLDPRRRNSFSASVDDMRRSNGLRYGDNFEKEKELERYGHKEKIRDLTDRNEHLFFTAQSLQEENRLLNEKIDFLTKRMQTLESKMASQNALTSNLEIEIRKLIDSNILEAVNKQHEEIVKLEKGVELLREMTNENGEKVLLSSAATVKGKKLEEQIEATSNKIVSDYLKEVLPNFLSRNVPKKETVHNYVKATAEDIFEQKLASEMLSIERRLSSIESRISPNHHKHTKAELIHQERKASSPSGNSYIYYIKKKST